MKIILLSIFIFSSAILGINAQENSSHREIHVNVAGSDNNDGTIAFPLKTIQAAANMAYPGDVVIVHEGVYREYVNPPRGGESKKKTIRYQAADGEKVEIRGSEIIKGWKHIDRNTWMVKIPNTFFGSFNPYQDTIKGDWLERGSWCHTGEVYISDTPLKESKTLDDLFLGETEKSYWFTEVKRDTTYLWANFIGRNPNEENTEINVRQSVFYPEKPYINYIHVKGFSMSHAATPWAPPTAEQIGLLGTHWSKGWIIEDNVISHSKCVGITLGKYGDEWDNISASAEAFVRTTERALENNWNQEMVGSHIVRNNRVSNCGQAGIAGSLGAIFSTITDNVISDIGLEQQFWGYEIAGLKLHAPIDVVISNNHIYRTELGIWLDWMTQGTSITGNFLHDNKDDLSLEVNHGPILVYNNLFLSEGLGQVKLSRGVAFINNIIAWKIYPTGAKDERATPYLIPHGTEIAGLHNCPCGDVSYYNNMFTRVDMTPYNACLLPVRMEGNLFLSGAIPAKMEDEPQMDSEHDANIKVVEEADGWYLYLNTSADWKRQREVIRAIDLAKAAISQQSFTGVDVPSMFDRDYLGNKRGRKQHYPGAIEFKKAGLQRIKVF